MEVLSTLIVVALIAGAVYYARRKRPSTRGEKQDTHPRDMR